MPIPNTAPSWFIAPPLAASIAAQGRAGLAALATQLSGLTMHVGNAQAAASAAFSAAQIHVTLPDFLPPFHAALPAHNAMSQAIGRAEYQAVHLDHQPIGVTHGSTFQAHTSAV